MKLLSVLIWLMKIAHKKELAAYSTVQKECKRISSNFGYCSLEISPKFRRNFGGKGVIFRPKFLRNFAEPHENSNAGRKFANLTTKFRLEFVRTETKIRKSNCNNEISVGVRTY